LIVLSASKSLSGGFRGTTRRRCGGFAKEVARNIENDETPTPRRERLEIRLDGNLDGLFAGVDFDTDSRVAKVHLVSSSVLSSDDGVGHCGLISRIVVSVTSADYRDARNPLSKP
jgi:hypothetical protein